MLGIFLHLGNNSIWSSIEEYLNRIKTTKYHLYINFHHKNQINKLLEEKILETYPSVTFFYYQNRGCDIGPFIKFIQYMIDNEIHYDFIMKLHSKTNNEWRENMLNSLIPLHFDTFYESLLSKKTNFHCSYLYPYDYFNIKYDVELLKMFGLDINYSWDKAIQHHPEMAKMNSIEKNIYSKHIDKELIPDIDLELYNHLFGNYNLDHTIVSGTEKWRIISKIKRLEGSRLFYAPGTFFMCQQQRLLYFFEKINIERLYQSLEIEKLDDNICQSKTHSLERVLCILCLTN